MASLQAATECIHIWMKKYLKPVLDSLTSTPEIQSMSSMEEIEYTETIRNSHFL